MQAALVGRVAEIVRCRAAQGKSRQRNRYGRSFDISVASQLITGDSQPAPLAAGYTGYLEVEIFNQEVWDVPPDDTAAHRPGQVVT
jgi:hypothetical protein